MWPARRDAPGRLLLGGGEWGAGRVMEVGMHLGRGGVEGLWCRVARGGWHVL